MSLNQNARCYGHILRVQFCAYCWDTRGQNKQCPDTSKMFFFLYSPDKTKTTKGNAFCLPKFLSIKFILVLLSCVFNVNIPVCQYFQQDLV